jgi:transforming growth factor-beta-induced protein
MTLHSFQPTAHSKAQSQTLFSCVLLPNNVKPNTTKMKKLGKPVLSWALALIVLFVTAIRCSDDKKSTPAPTQSIVALASANTNLTSLVAALSKFPDLVSTLSGTGNFTVFAPTNQAFTKLLADIGQTDINNVPDNVLKSILQYHVVSSAALKSTQLTAGNVNTVANENIAVTLNPIKLNGTVNVTTPDVLASNGVVHIVDAVLVNPTIAPVVGTVVAPAYFSKGFSILTAAVVKAGVLSALLDKTKQYTVFAPTNAAFIANLGASNEAAAISAVNALSQTTAADLLNFHVLSTEIKAGGIAVGTSSVTTIRATNNRAFVTKVGSAVTINNARVTTADIDVNNGVVHVIDAVLTPPVGDIVAVATSAANAANFNILVAALTKAGLVPTVQGTGPFTVFAPTDAAFLTLLSAVFGSNVDEPTALTFINNTISDTSTPINLPTLTSILTYHVVSGAAYSINLTNSQVLTTVKSGAPNTIVVGITGSAVTIDGSGSLPSTVAPANISATNGVVHVIDRVMQF